MLGVKLKVKEAITQRTSYSKPSQNQISKHNKKSTLSPQVDLSTVIINKKKEGINSKVILTLTTKLITTIRASCSKAAILQLVSLKHILMIQTNKLNS